MNFKPLFILLLTFLIFSCNKDAKDIDGGSTSSDTFSCKIDGMDHNISGQYAFAEAIDVDIFGIYGSEDQAVAGFTNVFISLTSEPTVGVYDLSKGDIGSGNILDTETGEVFNSVLSGGSGSLEVTDKTSTRIKGIFTFVASDGDGKNKTVTSGAFDVPIK